MSRTYGFRCTDCNDDSATNFQDWALKEIYELRHHFLALFMAHGNFASFKLEFNNDYDEPFLLSYLATHGEHALLIIDEYGNVQP